MKKYIVSAHTKDEKCLYLSDLDIINFSEFIDNSVTFESYDIAKSTLDNRYLSLSYWILSNVKEKELSGIYITELEDNIIGEEKRYL